MSGTASEALERLERGFRRALSAAGGGLREERFRFAGRDVRVRVVGRRLAETFLRPWHHLRHDDGGKPVLEVLLWDAAETGVSEPDLFFREAEDVAENEGADVSPRGDVVVYRRPETVFAYDREAQRIVGLVRAHDELTLYELGRPLHAPLLLWYRDRGHPALHSGLVEREGRGALLVGAGGSGKTTAALQCLIDGFHYVSDDYVGLARDEDRYFGHGLYGSTHVEPTHLRETFPELAPHAIEGRRPGEDKWLVLLTEVAPDRLSAGAPIDVVLLPNVGDRDRPRLRSASKGVALRRLAPSSLLMLPHARSRDLDRLALLVSAVPCHWLDLGREVKAISGVVERALDETG